jgi:hypothetical protein
VDTKLKTGIAESLSEPLMKIAQQLLISDKATFEQLTPTEQKLWTTFKTADIYRFLTGEEVTVPEFQYNWTSVPRLQPLGPSTTSTPPTPANTAPPNSYSITTTSSLSTKLGFKYITSYKNATLIANSFHFRDQAQAATATNCSSTTA